ncbi:sporulation integral membrane protein YtvI [Bacillaceae bacterium Marseille-Q3522]|nr:sporulation integral membrane protein YtvI [Bacillaceae bacterium Marseille-Q3522]
MNRTYLHRTFRFIFVVLIIVVLLSGALFISRLTYPFIIGLLIAYIMNPIVNFLQHKARMPRWLAVVISMILLFAILAGLITLLIAEIVSGADYLAQVVPDQIDTLIKYSEELFVSQIIPLYENLRSLFNNLGTGQQETIINNIQNVGNELGSTLGGFIQTFFTNIPNYIGWLPNFASVLVFSMLATFFISKDWDRIIRGVSRLLPGKARKSSKTVLLDLQKALFGFIKAQATLVSITTIIILIGLLILRVDYAVTIALVVGVLDVLPYLGVGVVFVPWVIYEVIVGNTGLAIGLGVLYTIVVVQRQIMEPKVLSSNIGLDPLATLISLFVGFKLLGVFGLIAGPVVLVFITTLHRTNVFRDIWSYIMGNDKESPVNK